MARHRRLDLVGIPQHLMVRGNNRTACFLADRDRCVYLEYLWKAAEACGCEVHAYVLMTNHVHLLTTGNERHSLSRMMHRLGTRYARYVNRAYSRTGTLFEGRFRSSLVDTGDYLFSCMRYIELNPVRAGMVEDPAHYHWSSYAHNALAAPCDWLTPRREYLRLGATPEERAMEYRSRFQESMSPAELAEIREQSAKGLAIGSAQFKALVEASTGITRRPVGRQPRALFAVRK